METIKQNKALVVSAYKRILVQFDFEYANSIIADNYIQHNPMVKSGKQGFLEFLTMLKQMPQPENPTKPFMRMFASEQFVVVHMKIAFMGAEKAVIDLYRIEDGKIAEHWDAVQSIQTETTSGNHMVVGSDKLNENENTETNVAIVERFCNTIQQLDEKVSIDEFVDSSIIQHNANYNNGINGLVALLNQRQNIRTHRIIGEHNYVLVQSEVVLNSFPSVLYDIYRLENGKIIEHWSVSQTIPEQMVHNNGMI